MKELKECDLYKYNTMRLHSTGDVMYLPENKMELKQIVDGLRAQGRPYHIVGAGSNVVFAERVHTPIVNLMEMDASIAYLDDGRVRVGASARVQSLIRSLQQQEWGGIEYLYSVPCSVGGAVYMNAGRGRDIGLAISDYLEEVEFYDPQLRAFQTYSKETADFAHRKSPFQGTDRIIVGATFRFRHQEKEVTERLIAERMEHSRKYLSADKPSCGSVFCKGNRLVYRLLMGQRIGGAMYSKKTSDWISNMGDATASDVMQLIDKGKRLHRFFLNKCKVEIRYIE